MKKSVLFMTVGTGIKGKEDESRDSEGHGIAFAIERSNPEKIVFFCTEESEKTLDHVLGYIRDDKLKKIFENSIRVRLGSYSDTISIIKDIKPLFEEAKINKERVIVVSTFGTKAMTSVIFNLGVLYKSELYSVEGYREGGIVKKGTETWQEQNVYQIFDMFYFDRLKDFFNRNNFDASLEYLNNIISEEIEGLKKNDLRILIEGFSFWDKFNHEEAYKKLKELNGKSLKEKFGENINFVKKLSSLKFEIREREKRVEDVKKEKNKLVQLLIIDLLANAHRRISEGKYDDAVARLYRLIEMIAQYELYSKYNLSVNEFFGEVSTYLDLYPYKDKFDNEEEMKEYVDKNLKMKIGLDKACSLLEKLGSDVGVNIKKNDEIKKLINIRNNSILAHGFNPIDEKTTKKLFFEVEKISKSIIIDYEELIESSNFKKF